MGLAWDAMQDTLLRTAGTSHRNGQRMERIFRDMTMGWSHFSNVVADWSARELAREHLGLVRGALRDPSASTTSDEGSRWLTGSRARSRS